MTIDDLAGRLFAGVPEVAGILGADERTIRRAIAAKEIPGHRIGAKYVVPVSWLREMAGPPSGSTSGTPEPNFDQLAERVADCVLARLARTFGALMPNVTAGPVLPGPAAIADDSPPPTERSRAHDNPAA